jgi:alkylated DNA repair dioxygenase AlkB
LPGEGFSAHVDDQKYGEQVARFMLTDGDRIVRFTQQGNNASKHAANTLIFDQYTSSRSLHIIVGGARWQWTHEMAKRKSDVVNED